MKKTIISSLALFFSIVTYGQPPKLSIFDNLVGKTWKAEGNWGDGSKFFQEITIAYSLDSTIVVAKSIGFVDEKQTSLGLRNHGIRQVDTETNSIKFWEFDVFGGLTEGKVSSQDKNIIYRYDYGGTTVTDMWEYVNDSTYTFKVGDYDNDSWKQVYLETQFRAQGSETMAAVYDRMKNGLRGQWTSKAWNGTLDENWFVDGHGHLNQQATYYEEGKLLYEACNKMELINNELILITVIKNANPKIFKAIAYEENQIVFENTEYHNPNKVVYRFLSDQSFEREISGMENNKPSRYIFKFVKTTNNQQ